MKLSRTRVFIPKRTLAALRRGLAALEVPKMRGRTAAIRAASKASGIAPNTMLRYLQVYREQGIEGLADKQRRRSPGKGSPGGPSGEVEGLLREIRTSLSRVEILIRAERTTRAAKRLRYGPTQTRA